MLIPQRRRLPRTRTALLALVAACGLGGSPTPSDPAQPSPAPRAAREVPAELRDAADAVLGDARPALAACRGGPLAGVTPEAAEAAPLPFDVAAFDAACGPALELFDRHAAKLGASPQLDSVLGTLARVGDDLAYLRRELARDVPKERRNAVEHVGAALGRATEATQGALEPRPYGADVSDPVDWRRAVDQDGHTLENLHKVLVRLGTSQGDVVLVRRRMLTAVFTAAEADAVARGEALARAELPEEERRLRLAWHEASAGARRRMHAIAEQCIAGDGAARHMRLPLHDEVKGIVATAWDARTRELARLDAAAATAGPAE